MCITVLLKLLTKYYIADIFEIIKSVNIKTISKCCKHHLYLLVYEYFDSQSKIIVLSIIGK